MLKFLENIIWGKKFKISIEQIKIYEDVRNTLKSFNDVPYIIRGRDLKRIEKNLPEQYKWTSPDCSENNRTFPYRAAMFFLAGHAWEEITDYENVRDYGRLYGKKRRLIIVKESLMLRKRQI